MYSRTTPNMVVPDESNAGLYNIAILKSTPFSFTNQAQLDQHDTVYC
jgi:hypothetical protein